jgi:hypothetical protein
MSEKVLVKMQNHKLLQCACSIQYNIHDNGNGVATCTKFNLGYRCGYFLETSIKVIGSRDGRAKKYTNKIYGDNHVHYTSLRLLFE